MFYPLKYIQLDRINITDKWNLHPWDLNDSMEILKESITQRGVLYPPFVLKTSDSNYEILAGAKRLLIAKQQLQIEKICCHIVPESTSLSILLDLILTDQENSSPLSIVEKARFLQLCNNTISEDEIVATFLPRLQLRRQASVIQKMLTFFSLEGEVIERLHKGLLHEKLVPELMSITPDDRKALLSIFQLLSLGTGKQKKFFTQIRDVANMKKISLCTFLASSDIEGIINHKEMNSPQKAQHLGSFLQRNITPDFYKAKSEFDRIVKELQLPNNCKIDHSPSFEKDEVSLSITFNNIKDVENVLPIIKPAFPKPKNK